MKITEYHYKNLRNESINDNALKGKYHYKLCRCLLSLLIAYQLLMGKIMPKFGSFVNI